MNEPFKEWFDSKRKYVNAGMRNILDDCRRDGPVWRAMEYSLFSGGKRIRPILFIAAYEASGGTDLDDFLPAGVAVELIHTYSLIHDDLPSLDDDALRRGVPTCHIEFGEAFAILAGDALLTLSFECLASIGTVAPEIVGRLVAETSRTAGIGGMIGGQETDLLLEGRRKEDVDEKILSSMHREKTGGLIRLPLRMGAIAAGADESITEGLGKFGELAGLAFQVRDDILDVVGETEKLGKTAGEDEAHGKATYPAVIGLQNAEKRAAQLFEQALDALPAGLIFSQRLEELAGLIVKRDH